MSLACWLLIAWSIVAFAQPAQPAAKSQTGKSRAGKTEPTKSQPPAAPRVPVAWVDDRPIHADEVDRLVDAAVRTRPIEPDAKAQLKAKALDQLIDQRVVEKFLEREKLSATDAEIKGELDRIKADAQAAHLDFAALLAERGTTEERLREQFRWELSWKKYLAREITDAALEKHFEAHRREFDGSELRVSHILLRTADEARALRDKLAAAPTSFAEAARQHSISPTASNGGDIGFIARRGSMTEEFSKAAFALRPGEISEPVVTQFGVHLIQVTEVRPGDKQWTDVREALRIDLSRQLFETIAKRERPKAKVRLAE